MAEINQVSKPVPQNVLLVEPNEIANDTSNIKGDRYNVISEWETLRPYVYFKVKKSTQTGLELDNNNSITNVLDANQIKEVNFLGFQEGLKGDTSQNAYTHEYTDYIQGADSYTKVGLEGFGIRDIDISIKANYIPVVIITFLDVKGCHTRGDFKNSNYDALFMYPPPVFELRIKGAYGKYAQYDLRLIKHNINIENNGDISIKCEFIGDFWGVLRDIPLAYLLTVPFLDRSIDETQPGIQSFYELVKRGVLLYDKARDLQEDSQYQKRIGANNEKIEQISNVLRLIQKEIECIIEIFSSEDSNSFEDRSKRLGKFVKRFKGLPDNSDIIIDNTYKMSNTFDGVSPSINRDELLIESNNLAIQYLIDYINDKNKKYNELTNIDAKIEIKRNGDILNPEITTSSIIINLENIKRKYNEALQSFKNRNNKIKEELEDNLNAQIDTTLDSFNPTIGNVLEVMCRDADRFLKMLYDSGKGSIMLKKADDPFIKGAMLEYPLVTKNMSSGKNNNSINFEQNVIYPGEIETFRSWSEVQFVERYCEALLQQSIALEEFRENVERRSDSNTTLWKPISVFDINTLGNINENAYLNEKTPQDVFKKVIERYVIAKDYAYLGAFPVNGNTALTDSDKKKINNVYEKESQQEIVKYIARNEANNLVISLLSNREQMEALKQSIQQLKSLRRTKDNYYQAFNSYTFSTTQNDVPSSNTFSNICSILNTDAESLQGIDSVKKTVELGKSFIINIQDSENISTVQPAESELVKLPDYNFVVDIYNTIFTDRDDFKGLLENKKITKSNVDYFVNEPSDSILDIPSNNSSNGVNESIRFNNYIFNTSHFISQNIQIVRHILIPNTINRDIVKICIAILANGLIDAKNNAINQAITIPNVNMNFIFGASNIFNIELKAILDDIRDTRIITDYRFLLSGYYELPTLFYYLLDFVQKEKNNYYNEDVLNNFNLIGYKNDLFDLNEIIDIFTNYFNELKEVLSPLLIDINKNELKRRNSVIPIASKYGFFQKKSMLLSSPALYWTTPTNKGRNAFDLLPNFLAVNKDINTFEIYMTSFLSELEKLLNKNTEKLDKKINALRSTIQDNNFKLAVYESFRTIYHRWLVNKSNQNTNSIFNFYSKFRIVDRAYRDISQIAIGDISMLIEGSKNSDVSMLNAISAYLSENNFDFYPLQDYVDYTRSGGENKLQKWASCFRIQKDFITREIGEPVFLAMYIGSYSKYLNINNKYYPDDSFLFDGLDNSKAPDDFNTTDSVIGTVNCFRVRYGLQNQQYFADISTGTQEFTNTDASLKNVENIVNRTANSNPVTKGQNLLNIYKDRAYSCSMTIPYGNMCIQPTFYFQLESLPIFRGVFMIFEVNHSINAESQRLVTTFKGSRVGRYALPIVDSPIIKLFNIDISTYGSNIQPDLSRSFKITSDNFGITNKDIQNLNNFRITSRK